jgi:dihydropteroate synthase
MLTPTASLAASEGSVRIAGREDLASSAVELIIRDGAKRTFADLLQASALRTQAGADGALAALLERIEAPRPPLAGLTLDRPRLMGIVNVTPDSFSDGGAFSSAQAAIDHALRLEAEGAEILDIGGESTRPGSDGVSVEEELRRVLPVIEGLAGRTKALISIDTRKAEVMRRALAAGAHIINDVAALTYEPACMEVAAASDAPIVLMHAQGDPRTMQAAPYYDDCLLDVCDWLAARIAACEAAGISRSRLVIDPGIGFGKNLAHNLELLAGLTLLHGLGVPLLLGASRKSFIGMLTGVKTARKRVPGSIAAALQGAAQGVQILRVHDVTETWQALTVWEAMQRGAT